MDSANSWVVVAMVGIDLLLGVLLHIRIRSNCCGSSLEFDGVPDEDVEKGKPKETEEPLDSSSKVWRWIKNSVGTRKK